MVFSSPIFLFAFLPVVLSFYVLAPAWARNAVLFAFSILFYFIDSGLDVLVLSYYIVVNWAIGLIISKASPKVAFSWFVTGLCANLGGLIIFKYTDFLLSVAGSIAPYLGLSFVAPHYAISLPLGISFFSFQAISYLADVHARRVAACKSFIDFGTYKSFFPQLIAGPIVRYAEVNQQLRVRQLTIDNIFEGMWRFSLGLGKKILIADPLATIVDGVFATPAGELTSVLVWLAVLCYAFQIYFDFSGYSDMAIGLARVFGFNFPENFNQPYRSQSITEFWRRWHMTLSRWFRDYLYIPLGGNREGPLITYRNLIIVFALCGLWHGAAYQFLVWGLFHGFWLIVERVGARFSLEPKGLLGTVYAFTVVLIAWVFFRANSLAQSFGLLGTMFHVTPDGQPIKGLAYYLTPDKITILAAAFFFSFYPFRGAQSTPVLLTVALRGTAAIALLILSAAAMAAHNFSPFIYFRF